MTRITVDVDDALIEAAREVLGTTTKVATINEALRAQAVKAVAADVIAALDRVPVDFTRSSDSFGYGGGRDLSALVEAARRESGA